MSGLDGEIMISILRMLCSIVGGGFIGNAVARKNNYLSWKLRICIGFGLFILSMIIIIAFE